MKLISENDLVKGETYYIEAISKFNQMSGKKIGIFDGFEYPFGNHIPFAKFIQLRDLPNATMPSGMGSYNVNKYSTLHHQFYLPEKDRIFENNYLKNIIDKYTGTNIGSYMFRPLYPSASHTVDNTMVEVVEKINPV